MDPVVITYLVYVPLSAGLTFWVARTLSRNGALFLREVFSGDERMAVAVNHLLVVGFVLSRMRRRWQRQHDPVPPVAPQGRVPFPPYGPGPGPGQGPAPLGR